MKKGYVLVLDQGCGVVGRPKFLCVSTTTSSSVQSHVYVYNTKNTPSLAAMRFCNVIVVTTTMNVAVSNSKVVALWGLMPLFDGRTEKQREGRERKANGNKVEGKRHHFFLFNIFFPHVISVRQRLHMASHMACLCGRLTVTQAVNRSRLTTGTSDKIFQILGA